MFKILEKNLFNQLARTVDIWNLPIINYDLYMKGVVTIKKYIKLHIVRRFCIILLLICEFNKFNKILVAFGDEEEPLIHDPYRLPLSVKLNKNADRRIQKRAMKVLSQYYVLGWLPGMLVSRFVVMRGVRLMDKSRNKKIHYLVKKYKTVFRRLHHLPDLLVLNTMYGRGYIAAKEAVKLNVPTIAINNSNAFPSKVFTRLFGNDRHMMSIYFFVLMIQEIMDCGHELNKNFLTIKKYKFDRREFYEATKDKFGIVEEKKKKIKKAEERKRKRDSVLMWLTYKTMYLHSRNFNYKKKKTKVR